MTMNKQFIVRPDVPKEPALIIKNQLLLSPGKWKGQTISRESILNGLQNTHWGDGKSNSIIYGHRTNTTSTYLGDPSPDMWVGYHSPPKYLTLADGVSVEGMYADYYIYDTDLASKLAYGGVRAGVSEGMEYDYRTGEINRFINSSVVNDPACKNAFLNLSEEEESKGMELSEPRFLNMSKEEEKKEKEELKEDKESKEEKNDNTAERRLNGENMDKDMEDKIKAFDDKVSKVESALDEISKKLSEKKEEEKPKEEKKVEEPKSDEPKETVDEPKISEVKESKPEKVEEKKPVVMDAPAKEEESKKDNSEVVNAINKMGDKFTEEVKKVANPQSVAPTNPNAAQSNMDDEKVTDQLVEQYSKLHPENNSNE